MFNPLQGTFRHLAGLLARFGLIDETRGKRVADLAWPRMVTGLARKSQQTADVAMIGIALGPAAIASLAFASAYWAISNSFTLSLTGGTLNQVSQRYGADARSELDLAVKQSVLIGLVIGSGFAIIYWLFSTPLIGLFDPDQRTAAFGASYLQVLGIAMIPNFFNTICSRTLAGADDTWIPMVIRAASAVINIVLNAVFIFGLGMGVAGAATGTVLAEFAATILFTWGFVFGRIPFIGEFPVRLSVTPPYFDAKLSGQLLKLAAPLIVRRSSMRLAMFPLLALLAVFGPTIVAAYEVARRVRGLANTPGWGFSMSASSLVGQELGKGAEDEAEAYGHDIIRFMFVTYLVIVTFLLVFARPITLLFVQKQTVVTDTVVFVRIGAISLLGKGIDNSMTGVLKGAGDNRWPLYAKFTGMYVFMIPLIYLGTITSLGIVGVYLAIIAETFVPAAITGYRFSSDKWKIVSRQYRPSSGD